MSRALALIEELAELPSPFVPVAMDVECPYCGALRYRSEPKGMCCSSGKVQLELPPDLPEALHNLIMYDKEFKCDIRKYNQAFAFTSLRANVDERLASQCDGVYTFRINGQLYHHIGPLVPEEGESPKFSQIYFYEKDYQLCRRGEVMPGLSEPKLALVQDILYRHNPYVHLYTQAREMCAASGAPDYGLAFRSSGVDLRRFNAPTVSEVGAVLPDGDSLDGEPLNRQIRVRCRGGPLRIVSELHASYDPLMYVLMFPYGTPGWHDGVLQANGGRRVTMKQFAAHRLMIRRTNMETNPLHLCGRLFQQYIVDQYAKIETNNLHFVRNNQSALRADSYTNLRDAFESGGGQRMGRRIILPSSFTGGPRHMQQLYQDSMSIVRKYGKADLFVTMTCNPRWIGIEQCLLRGQTAQDRPDICARVFNQYLKAMMNDICKNKIFGTVIAHIHTIEFQKRGLPHAHILLWLSADDKPRSSSDTNKFISAEIPDREKYPELYEIVKNNMIHGPCGQMNPNAPCMRDGICTKGFPKSYCNETVNNVDGYPLYRRCRNERIITKMVRGRQYELDNRWVVPYNWYLLLRYKCHINVEQCSSIQSVRYIHKYVCKGSDRAAVRLSDSGESYVDEISDYVEARYISPVEACWRILGFKMHSQSHAIHRLPVHLPNEHTIVFSEDMRNMPSISNRTTKLLAFFDLCNHDIDAQNIAYHDVPLHYVWQNHQWIPRQRGTNNIIGRMYTVSVSEGERFYLRMLLCHVKGPKSFRDIRTFDGQEYQTFQAACVARGLLEDDREWHICLQEAAQTASPLQLRHLFSSILVFGQPAEPAQLFNDYQSFMSRDIIRMNPHYSPDFVLCEVASQIDNILRQFGTFWSRICGLPPIDFQNVRPPNANDECRTILEELHYNRDIIQSGLHNVECFNSSQKRIFDTVIDAIEQRDHRQSNLFFVCGEGGTGKTFLYSGISAFIRNSNDIVINVASSGIAALLLPGGHTAHSRFKIPLHLTHYSTCNITAQSDLARLVRATKLIIWDEAPMMHRHAFEALDRTLRDILSDNRPMGGMVVLFGGDWRQVLPVVPNGSRREILTASLMYSTIWPHVTQLTLTQNMRIIADQNHHVEWLRTIGDGSHSNFPLLSIPSHMLLNDGQLSTLIDHIYPQFIEHYNDTEYLMDRVILAPTHKDVNLINELMTSRIPTTARSNTYFSADSVQNDDDSDAHTDLFPVEFLNSLDINGLPPHKLTLTEGMPIILLRNLNKSMGLCNGTRLIVHRLQSHVIEAEVITGGAAGTHVYIPRITLSPPESTLPFILRRRQFPVKPAFSMTINKAQGQTIPVVGVALLKSVFSHGQLYVALSRSRNPNNIKVLLPRDHTATMNFVYQEVFQ